MKYLKDLKEMLCDELMDITRQGEIKVSSLDTIDKLTHSIKSIEAIMAMGQTSSYGSYRGSYENDSYDGYSSRRRDSMGRYSRAESDMVEKLEKMADEAHDSRSKEAIMRALSEIRG